jgi:hypothetical protein
MRKIFMTFVAALGLVGFAAAAQAECAGHVTMAGTADSTTVATDNTTTKPILPDQSGG